MVSTQRIRTSTHCTQVYTRAMYTIVCTTSVYPGQQAVFRDHASVSMHQLHYLLKYISMHSCIALGPFRLRAVSGLLALAHVRACRTHRGCPSFSTIKPKLHISSSSDEKSARGFFYLNGTFKLQERLNVLA